MSARLLPSGQHFFNHIGNDLISQRGGKTLKNHWFPPLKYMGLANAITTTVTILGLVAMILAVKGEFVWAFTCYGTAVLGDYADGIVARKLKQTSTFGMELDSLADAISFCVMPAFCGYALGMDSPLEIVCLALFVGSGVWRLAYFNVTGLAEEGSSRYYSGVPTTITASWLLCLSPIMLAESFVGQDIILPIFFILCALLMISSVPFRKHGIATNMLFALLPIAVILNWILYGL